LLDHADFKQRAKILIQLSGGFRISELLGLRKCDFNTDLERYTAYIRPKYAKNSVARTTIISIEAMKYVDQLIQNLNDTDLLFPHNEKNIKFACVSEMNIFGRLRERAKLNEVYEGKKTHKITTHSLRAFFITQFEKTSSGFGHSLSGQSRYLKQYERFTLADKLEKYIETEKHLLIYSNIESEQKMKRELLELQAKVSRLEQLQQIK
jgi:integrase